jgi:hypothetical protein
VGERSVPRLLKQITYHLAISMHIEGDAVQAANRHNNPLETPETQNRAGNISAADRRYHLVPEFEALGSEKAERQLSVSVDLHKRLSANISQLALIAIRKCLFK